MSLSETRLKEPPSRLELGKDLADKFVKSAGFNTPHEVRVNDLGCASIIYDNSEDHITTILPSGAHPFIEISHTIPLIQKQDKESSLAIAPLTKIIQHMAKGQNIDINVKPQGDNDFYVECQTSTTEGVDYKGVAMTIGGIDNLVMKYLEQRRV